MLRIWHTSNGETSVWSASLEKPGTHERLGFANLDALFRFLQDEICTEPPASDRSVDSP
jgi:hypothetical protein